jgi:glutathione synthase/RimK-type ligase-like ATP-grasp enzyme
MRIAFFVNSIKGESPNYTTTVVALAAVQRGHEVCYVTPGDFVLSPDDSLAIRAHTLPGSTYKKATTLFKDLQGEAEIKRMDASEIDVLFLRNDPSLDAAERPPMWGLCSAGSPPRGACSSSTTPTGSRAPRTSSISRISRKACGPKR